MSKYKDYKNKDKLNDNIYNINRHSLKIKKLINILTLRFNLFPSQIVSDFEPYTTKNPQNRPYGMNKTTLKNIYSVPKYLINKPTISQEKDSQVLIFSFPVVCLTPEINHGKTSIIKQYKYTNGLNNLTLFQLNIVHKIKSGKYSISLHQNCFEKGLRQPVFLGRCEKGETHNTHHEKVDSTFHIHLPYDANIDTKFQNTMLGAIYHCQPEVYSNQNYTDLNTAIIAAKKLYNIRNEYDDAVDLKRSRIDRFLESACGREWNERLLEEPFETSNFNQIYNILETQQSLTNPKQDDLTKCINSRI